MSDTPHIPEYQLAVKFNKQSFIRQLKRHIDITIERVFNRGEHHFATISVTGTRKKNALANVIRKKFPTECEIIGEMTCADISKVPSPFMRVVPA